MNPINSVSPVMQRQTCYPLRKFATKELAAVAARNIASSQGKHRRPYPCSKCNGWHLSTNRGES